jgi:ankyrin repeat protein
MPTEKASLFTLAKFGGFDVFKGNFALGYINEKSNDGSGLLHYAISGGQFDIASYLIDRGVDVNLENADGQTALHLICVNQNIEVAKKILLNGGDINIRDRYGNNAMWAAVFHCKGKNYEIVELFMQYNPDIRTKNKAGRSPVDFAQKVGNERLLRMLLML